MKSTYNKIKNNKTIKKQKINNNKDSVSNPIGSESNSQIISGYFLNEKSYKELVITRINNFLYVVLGILILFCLVCYYFVSCKEVKLNQISRATLELNYENDELQNKVDSLQSYYNIDKAVSKANILERAEKVVEVNAIDLSKINVKNKKIQPKHESVVVGF